MDPAKMKVVDLRSELGALGLDTKGNKATLVDRLKKALESKSGTKLPDTSILDTSNEDADEPSTPRKPAPRTTRRTSSSRLAATPAKVLKSETPPPVVLESPREEEDPPTPPPAKEKAQEQYTPEVSEEEETSVHTPEIEKNRSSSPETAMEVDHEDEREEQTSNFVATSKDDDESNKEESDTNTEDSETHKGDSKTNKEDSKTNKEDSKTNKEDSKTNKEDSKTKKDDSKTNKEDKENNKSKKEDENKEKSKAVDEKHKERRPMRERELTEEEEWEQLNERLIIREKERLERERLQAEEDAKKLEELKDNPVKLQRLKRKYEKKARWSNFYKNIEKVNEILTPPAEPATLLSEQKKQDEAPKNVEPELNDNKVTLSWYDSDLNQYLELPELSSVVAMSEGPFSHAWAGVRATHGVVDQRVCFEVRVGSIVTTTESAEKDTLLNGLRIGWSTDDSDLHLGEGEFSFGYENTGRAVNNSQFKEYGKTFAEKDVIGAYLDLESSPCKISFTLNGVELGTAFEFERSALGGRALFPHVLTKNMCYKVNMGYERYNLLSKTKIVRKTIQIPVEQVLEEKKKRDEEMRKKKEEVARKRQERQKKRKEEREKQERERKEAQAKKDKEKSEQADKDKTEQTEKKESAGEKKELAGEKKESTGEKKESAGEKKESAGEKKDDDVEMEEDDETAVPKANGESLEVEVKVERMDTTEKPKEEGKQQKKEDGEQVQVVTEEQVYSGVFDRRVKFIIRHTAEEELDGPEACLVPGYVLLAHAATVEGPRRPAALAHCEDIVRRSVVNTLSGADARSCHQRLPGDPHGGNARCGQDTLG
ncbi:uncharacterized protein DDB_G0284459 isoform X3 [Leptidea sinapis]|uniref:uncharacterized protein DDB_G0284459 isoform X3 n=1 Tax=Leptidea sinapis TaxID=189913 RepID=UPI0021215B52|nr:uncharacterized protein DDB_G0284459 isoform X3 [Leptidea sinapis]